MRKFITILLSFTLIVGLSSCDDGKKSNGKDGKDTTSADKAEKKKSGNDASVKEKNGIKIYPMKGSPEFANASIELNGLEGGANLEPGPHVFDFQVEGYELGVQTSDAKGKGIANSDGGQHIHVILNDQPYMAHYEPSVNVELEKGRYLLTAFLSRSYHESVKNDVVFTHFSVGDVKGEDPHDVSAPSLIYSRPKGTYSGKDAKKIMLDFFLVNTDLKEDGYLVKADINGTEFMFDTWQPYLMEGLPEGDVDVTLSLVNAAGEPIEGHSGPITRTITVEK